MSREIKFRVWFKPTWEYKCDFEDRYHRKLKDLSCSYYTQEALFDDTWIDTDCYDSIEIEQYTGLKDKNGKEIYEGDIVDKAYHNIAIYDKNGAVEMGYLYDSDGYRNGEIYGWKAGDSSLVDVCGECEVIGNIHENPELLEDAE